MPALITTDLVALDADAGNALQRLGDIRIGEAADIVGRDDVGEVVGLPLLVTAIALFVSGYAADTTMILAALIVAAIGIFCTFGVFWTLPTAWLSGTAAAGGIALINSIGNLAGFGGPYLIGWIKESTGSTATGLLVLAAMPAIAGILVLAGNHRTEAEFAGQPIAK